MDKERINRLSPNKYKHLGNVQSINDEPDYSHKEEKTIEGFYHNWFSNRRDIVENEINKSFNGKIGENTLISNNSHSQVGEQFIKDHQILDEKIRKNDLSCNMNKTNLQLSNSATGTTRHRGNKTPSDFNIEKNILDSNLRKPIGAISDMDNEMKSNQIATAISECSKIHNQMNESKMNSNSETHEFKMNVIKNLVRDNKIPPQILNDELFKRQTKPLKYCKDRVDKIAEVLINLYDIVIKPCNSKKNENDQSQSPKNGIILPNSISSLNNNLEKTNCLSNNSVNQSFKKALDNSNITGPDKNSSCLLKKSLKSINSSKNRINIIQKTKFDLSSHLINKTIGLINNFLSLTSKNKESDYNIHSINQVYKKLGLSNSNFRQHMNLDQIKNNVFMS